MRRILLILLFCVFTAKVGWCLQTNAITNEEYILSINKSGGVELLCGNDTMAFSHSPVTLAYKNAVDSSVVGIKRPYSHVEPLDGGRMRCTSHLVMADGTEFDVVDTYSTGPDNVFIMDRNVAAVRIPESSRANGFRTSYLLDIDVEDGAEWFIPSIIYRDTKYMRRGAVASTVDSSGMYVKETRTGLPLAMVRDSVSGNTIALMHLNPQIGVGDNPGGGADGEINSELKYGSLGYVDGEAVTVGYNYPCIEGPRTYEPLAGGRRSHAFTERFHNVLDKKDHAYKLAIIPGRYGDYNSAMTSSYMTAYKIESPAIYKVDMDAIYRQNIELLNAEWRSMGTGKIKAAGLPWSLDLPDGKNTEGVSFQMGFVGQQISVGYHLYRYGFEHADSVMMKKGETIIDFWTSDAVNSTYFPTVWWDPADDDLGGRRREYPSFLRCMADGMEGLLDACSYASKIGCPKPEWESVLRTVVGRLVEKQNSDGSFFRAYRTDGSVEEGGDRNTHGKSVMNTHIPVRLLARMYAYTGDINYKKAALAAAEFAYDVFYTGMGKYVGGTPDNPNTVDKEAAIYALYCFNAAHDISGDSKYLKAAEHAAVNAMSWTYCYDFAIPNRDEWDKARNPFSKGGILGFSIIATGHSGADNFISYMCHEMFRLYVKTGNETYRQMASFLLNNTKLNTDYDGRMGYKYRAFMPEATSVADFAFRSVSLWLPWSSIANIDPLVKLIDEYGTMDVDFIDINRHKWR